MMSKEKYSLKQTETDVIESNRVIQSRTANLHKNTWFNIKNVYLKKILHDTAIFYFFSQIRQI